MASYKYYIGVLLLVILSTSIYVSLPDKVRLDVTGTSAVFSQWEESKWVNSATEYLYLWDGTTKMRASSRAVTSSVDGSTITVKRTSTWKDNITTIHSYIFDSSENNVELVPIIESLVCVNCAGKTVNFEYTKFGEYSGITKDISSPFSFGNKMKVEWQDGTTLSKIYQQKLASDKIEIKYKAKTNYETYDVRLFDPAYSGLSPVILDGVNISKYGIASGTVSNYSGLVQWLKLEKTNSSWNFTDSSGNGNHGTRWNMSDNTLPVYTTDGATGGAYKLDGFIQRIDMGSLPTLANTVAASQMSLDLWMKPDDVTQSLRIISKYSGSGTTAGVILVRQLLQNVDFVFYNSTPAAEFGPTSATNIFTKGVWTKLTFTYNAGTAKLYVNGILKNTTTGLATTIPAYAYPWTIGYDRRDIGTNGQLNGTIDEVTLWNRTLTDSEVIYLYNSTKNIYNQHDLGASIVNSSEPPTNTTISYVYDWRLFNQSIAVFNMPFDLNGSSDNWTTILDYSSFANNAEYNGTVETMPRWNRTGGYDGLGTYEFDGTDDSISASSNDNASGLNPINAITISAWVNLKKLSSVTSPIVAKDGMSGANRQYNFYIPAGSGALSALLSNSSGLVAFGSYTLPINSWQYVVMTYDGSIARIYVNGAIKDTQSIAGPLTTSSTPLRVGTDNLATGRFFNGTIDQLQIFNRTLTLAQIQKMYASGVGHYNVMSSTETNLGDNWTVVVTPVDGDNDGLAYTSNIANILSMFELNWTAAYNTSGTLISPSVWLMGGKNVTFNATTTDDSSVNYVWVTIWNSVKSTGTKFATSNMNLINGIWQTTVATNTNVVGHYVNYTIYGNSSSGNVEDEVDGTFFYNYAPSINGVNLTKYVVAQNTIINYSGLNLWFKMEKGNGTFFNDSSGNGNFGKTNGSVQALPTYTAEGATGGAYKFDGIYDKLTMGSSGETTTQGTVTAWIKMEGPCEGAEGIENFVSGNGQAMSYFSVSLAVSKLQSFNGIAWKAGTTTINYGRWYFATLSYDSVTKNMKIYTNGVLESNTTDGNDATAPGLTTLGASNAGNRQFNGTIDEVTYWNRTLTDAEVLYLYNNTNNIYRQHDIGASVVNETDYNKDVVNYVYNWNVNGGSITLLNLPFDSNYTLNGTTSKDYSSFGRNAEYNGTAVALPIFNATGGFDGVGGYQFDGVDDWMKVSSKNVYNLGTNNFTVMAWFKPEIVPIKNIFMIDNGATLVYVGAGMAGGTVPTATIRDTAMNSLTLLGTTTMVKGNWYHIAAVRSGVNFTIYLNGKAENTSVSGINTLNTNADWYIGAQGLSGGSVSSTFNGTIDKLQMYNMSLSAEQVKEMYSNGFGRYNVITNSDTSIGENWSVMVTPTDGFSDGISRTSNSLYVENSPMFCGAINVSTVLTQNLNSDSHCLTINASNIFLDGSGYTLTGNGSGFGIYNNGNSNVSIFNLTISNYTKAIYFVGFSNIPNIHNNRFIANGTYESSGTYAVDINGYNITVADNVFVGAGLKFSDARNLYNNVSNNFLYDNASHVYAIYLNSAVTNGSLAALLVNNNSWTGYLYGLSILNMGNGTVSNNIGNGTTTGAAVNTDTVSNFNFYGNNITYNPTGIFLYLNSNGNKVFNNSFSNNSLAGLTFSYVANNTAYNNTFRGTKAFPNSGISSSYANFSNITDNAFIGNFFGLQEVTPKGTRLFRNYFINNPETVQIGDATGGIYSDNNCTQGHDCYYVIRGNSNIFANTTVFSSAEDVGIDFETSHNNTAYGNTLSGTILAFFVEQNASNNSIHDNTISTACANCYGMQLDCTFSTGGHIEGNNVFNNNFTGGVNAGIYATQCNNSRPTEIRNNTFNNIPYGIQVYDHDSLLLINNNFTNITIQSIRTIYTYMSTMIYNNSYGEIGWYNLTNITVAKNNFGIGNGIVLQDNLTGIESNSGLSSLNRTATVRFFNVVVTDPILLKDGARCDNNPALCSTVVYSGGVASANVTSFSNYSILPDTCSCPQVLENWVMNVNNNCTIKDSCNIGLFDWIFSGAGGHVDLSATITAKNLLNISDSQILYINSTGKVNLTG